MINRRQSNRRSTRTPTIGAGLINVCMERNLRVFCALRLILRLCLARLTRNYLLRDFTAILTTAIIRSRRRVTLFYRMNFPTATEMIPTNVRIINIESAVCVCGNEVLLIEIRIR